MIWTIPIILTKILTILIIPNYALWYTCIKSWDDCRRSRAECRLRRWSTWLEGWLKGGSLLYQVYHIALLLFSVLWTLIYSWATNFIKLYTSWGYAKCAIMQIQLKGSLRDWWAGFINWKCMLAYGSSCSVSVCWEGTETRLSTKRRHC